MWLVWAVLLVVAVSLWLRRRSRRPHVPTRRDPYDQMELEAAEEEVRGLDIDQQPDDGWAGDDWGPGAPR